MSNHNEPKAAIVRRDCVVCRDGYHEPSPANTPVHTVLWKNDPDVDPPEQEAIVCERHLPGVKADANREAFKHIMGTRLFVEDRGAE